MQNRNQSAGRWGEEIATNFLLKKGYQIVERNFRLRNGEIDIVAIEPEKNSLRSSVVGRQLKQGVLVFVEVKTRRSNEYGTPFEAISRFKLKSLVNAVQVYKLRHPNLPDAMRIDAIGIKFLDEIGKEYEIEHLENIGY